MSADDVGQRRAPVERSHVNCAFAQEDRGDTGIDHGGVAGCPNADALAVVATDIAAGIDHSDVAGAAVRGRQNTPSIATGIGQRDVAVGAIRRHRNAHRAIGTGIDHRDAAIGARRGGRNAQSVAAGIGHNDVAVSAVRRRRNAPITVTAERVATGISYRDVARFLWTRTCRRYCRRNW